MGFSRIFVLLVYEKNCFSYNIDCSFPCFLSGSHHTLIISKLSCVDKSSKLFFFFLNLCYHVYLHLYPRTKLQVSVPEQKQLLQMTLFVLFFCFSEKRTAKIMMKGAHYKAKMNTCPKFRRNVRQTCTRASMENGNLSNFSAFCC